MLVAQVGNSYDSHNSLQHLAGDFIDSQGNKHADFPNFPVVPSNCTPCMQDGTGDMEKIGMINQRKNPLEDTLDRNMEGVWCCRLYKHSSCISVRSCIHHTTPVTQSSVNRIHSYIVVKYTCLSNIRIHYSKPLSDGSKKPDERSIGTSRTSHPPLCPYTIHIHTFIFGIQN